jgi:hypothetical protein
MALLNTLIFCAALAGIALIVFLVTDAWRTKDPDRYRRLRVRARARQLQAQAAAEAPPELAAREQAERESIESRLESERQRSALVDQ